jgi:hypothetical protein
MKKYVLAAIALTLVWTGISLAAATYGTVTVADTAIGFTTVPSNANIVNCDLETGPIRYRYDGAADPTSSEGHTLNVGQGFRLTNRFDMVNFRAIRSTGTSGTLKCTFSDR